MEPQKRSHKVREGLHSLLYCLVCLDEIRRIVFSTLKCKSSCVVSIGSHSNQKGQEESTEGESVEETRCGGSFWKDLFQGNRLLEVLE